MKRKQHPLEDALKIKDGDSIEEMERKARIAEVYYMMKRGSSFDPGFFFLILGLSLLMLGIVLRILDRYGIIHFE